MERHSGKTVPEQFGGGGEGTAAEGAGYNRDERLCHMEKFGSFGMQFPTNDEQITTEAGDVILSEGNLLVIYYAPNTWNLRGLGKSRTCPRRN